MYCVSSTEAFHQRASTLLTMLYKQNLPQTLQDCTPLHVVTLSNTHLLNSIQILVSSFYPVTPLVTVLQSNLNKFNILVNNTEHFRFSTSCLHYENWRKNKRFLVKPLFKRVTLTIKITFFTGQRNLIHRQNYTICSTRHIYCFQNVIWVIGKPYASKCCTVLFFNDKVDKFRKKIIFLLLQGLLFFIFICRMLFS